MTTNIERAITANKDELRIPARNFDRNLYSYEKSGQYPSKHAPFIPVEYSVVFTDIDDGFNGRYSGEHEEMHVIVLDEDNIPIIGSIVSKDDDLIQAVNNVAFLAGATVHLRFAESLTDSQLQEGIKVAQEYNPVDDEMLLLSYALKWLYNMNPADLLFAESKSRKGTRGYEQYYKGDREKAKNFALRIWNG